MQGRQIMKFIGHTMGTPGRTVTESVAVFAALGLDGVELICQEGSAFNSTVPESEARRLAEFAADAGAPVTTITPYAWDINSADPAVAEAQIGELQRAIDLAEIMGATYVRAYGGREFTDDPEAAVRRTAQALTAAGAYAARRGIVILVENHPGTMVRTGRATRQLVDAVGLDTVRALYDPANVLYDTDEDWETTLDVQTPVIGYVHVKDYDDRSGKRHACNVGDGVVPWKRILQRLVEAGYDGCLSFEYEKKWYPDDLEDAEVGMKASVEFVKNTLAG
jgi:sugar phosphate isomerase/epimerase